ncbi:hypothetical protein THRCLA_08065 [Thraustotheca clavata]|uniref:B30.2/SPRY domain-containing protein n=1 Tax=Thraustotheca clavata TaxID=74557 RepID=A0A1V9ZA92_9STRA|nr:hypothetical protein THRCLA_08065 [Thraustotheca clavata]
MAALLSADVRLVGTTEESLLSKSLPELSSLNQATSACDAASASFHDQSDVKSNENDPKQENIKEESILHQEDPIVEMIKSIRQECIASKKTIRNHQKDLVNIQQAQQASMDQLIKQFDHVHQLIERQQEELNKQYTMLDKRQNSIDTLLPTISNGSIKKRVVGTSSKQVNKRLKAEDPITLVPKDKFIEIPHTKFQWDLDRCGPYAFIRNNAHSIYTTQAGWNVVVGTCTAKRFAVQITLPKNKYVNTIAIGFTHEPNFWRDPINKHPKVFFFNHTGWYMNIRKGTLCSRDHDDSPFASKLKSGDVLSSIWDDVHGTIRFLRNDIDMGVAFKGIFNHHNWQLYPAIVSYDKNIEITILDP